MPDSAPLIDNIQNQVQQTQSSTSNGEPVELTAQQIEEGKFAKSVFKSTENTLGKIFQQNGREYEQPKMVLFSDAVETACGGATSASGPFYCPGDHKVRCV